MGDGRLRRLAAGTLLQLAACATPVAGCRTAAPAALADESPLARLERKATELAVRSACRKDRSPQTLPHYYTMLNMSMAGRPTCGLIYSSATGPDHLRSFAAVECDEKTPPFTSACHDRFLQWLTQRLLYRYPHADYDAVADECGPPGRRACTLSNLELAIQRSHNAAVGAWYFAARRALAAGRTPQPEPTPTDPAQAHATLHPLVAAVPFDLRLDQCPEPPGPFFQPPPDAASPSPPPDAGGAPP